MSALLRLAVAFLMALVGLGTVPGPTLAATDSVAHSYTYDSAAATSSTLTHAETERGPPTTYDREIAHVADGQWSAGSLARSGERATLTKTTCDADASFTWIARGTGTTIGHAEAVEGISFALDRWRVAANTESTVSRLLGSRVRDERGSVGPFGKGTTEAGNRGARYSGRWYDSEAAARRAAIKYAGKHPRSCSFRGLCGAGDHYHVDKEIGGFLVHTRHYYFPR